MIGECETLKIPFSYYKHKMGALQIILITVGILAFLEGSMTIFIPKFSLRMLKKFNRSTEKHIKKWGIGEMVIAITLIILGIVL